MLHKLYVYWFFVAELLKCSIRRNKLETDNKTNKSSIKIIVIFCILFVIYLIAKGSVPADTENKFIPNASERGYISLLISNENKDIGQVIQYYCNKNDIDVQIEYAGTIDIMEKINANSTKYDGVLASNSIWLYMLNSDIKTSNSKSLYINPVIFALRSEKLKELGINDKIKNDSLYMKDLIDAINNGNLKFAMSNGSQTNSGATAYLGILNSLKNREGILTEEDLEKEEIKTAMINFFSKISRTSGSEDFLEEIVTSEEYDAVITYESSLISINQKLEKSNKDTYYALYPIDGVSISDNPFCYINNGDDRKLDKFTKIQSYLLSDDGQKQLLNLGRRTWYGGTNNNVDKKIFNPNWGIDTSKYLYSVNYPSTDVIKKALNLYQNELRKPINIVMCLDYSGSMYGKGNEQLEEAIKFILNKEEASKNFIQFSSKDKISIILFSNKILGTYSTDDGEKTEDLIQEVVDAEPFGGTDMYLAAISAYGWLYSQDDTYNKSIILMTDGQSSTSKKKEFEELIKRSNKNIPIYSIMFGDASESQLQDVANLTSAKVFDGSTSLIAAFKEVRSYN